jgi:hypothetical protein
MSSTLLLSPDNAVEIRHQGITTGMMRMMTAIRGSRGTGVSSTGYQAGSMVKVRTRSLNLIGVVAEAGLGVSHPGVVLEAPVICPLPPLGSLPHQMSVVL